MIWSVAIAALALLVFALALALWMTWRSRGLPGLPRIPNSRGARRLLDDLRREHRGKPFDDNETTRQRWT